MGSLGHVRLVAPRCELIGEIISSITTCGDPWSPHSLLASSHEEPSESEIRRPGSQAFLASAVGPPRALPLSGSRKEARHEHHEAPHVGHHRDEYDTPLSRQAVPALRSRHPHLPAVFGQLLLRAHIADNRSRMSRHGGDVGEYNSAAPAADEQGETTSGGSLASDEAVQALREKLTGGE